MIVAPPLIAEKSHVDAIADILRRTLADALSKLNTRGEAGMLHRNNDGSCRVWVVNARLSGWR